MHYGTASTLALLAVVAMPTHAAADDDSSALDKALERYWGDERESPAVQYRLHPRVSRTEFAAHFGLVPGDAFRSYTAPGASVTHFLYDSLSVGLRASFLQQSYSKLGDFLVGTFPKNESLDAAEQYKMLAGVDVGWVPFYGKLSLLGFKLAHFDLGAYFGGGVAHTSFLDTDVSETSEGMAVAGDTGLGMRLYITKWVTLRFDWRQHFILARRPEGGVLLPSTLMVGLGTMYPYTEDRP